MKEFLTMEESNEVRFGRVVPDKHYKIIFYEDPLGNIIEIYNHSY